MKSQNGQRIKLQTAHHRGEYKLDQVDHIEAEEPEKEQGVLYSDSPNGPVDGYANVDGKEHFYEFNGCKWHSKLGCPHCTQYSTHGQGNNSKKLERLREIGSVECMWECLWDGWSKRNRHLPTPSFPLIMNPFGPEYIIKQGIKSGTLFGFILCDVETPSPVIAKLLHLNFPPIFRHEELDESYISPYIKSVMAMGNVNLKTFKRRSLIQCFNAKSILLFTPLVRFYMEWGMEINNIQWFIQVIYTCKFRMPKLKKYILVYPHPVIISICGKDLQNESNCNQGKG